MTDADLADFRKFDRINPHLKPSGGVEAKRAGRLAGDAVAQPLITPQVGEGKKGEEMRQGALGRSLRP